MLPAAAHADVTVIADVLVKGHLPQMQMQRGFTVSSQSPGPSGASAAGQPETPPQPTSVTIRYRGKAARTDVAGGPVIIYDDGPGKAFTLQSDAKTYTAVPLKDAEKGTLPFRLPPGADLETSGNLTKADDTMSIAGRQAQKYTITATVTAHRTRGSGGRHGGGGYGGRHGGGGYFNDTSGGQFGGGGQYGGRRRAMPTLNVTGELWVVDAGMLPAENKHAYLPLLQQVLGPGSVLDKSLADSLAKLKLVPLSSTLTITLTDPNAASDQAPEPVVVTMTVKSIATDSLDDTLFKVPSDFKLVTPTAAPPQ
jgi:hypothetical protein